jgi:hypothetical protein
MPLLTARTIDVKEKSLQNIHLLTNSNSRPSKNFHLRILSLDEGSFARAARILSAELSRLIPKADAE